MRIMNRFPEIRVLQGRDNIKYLITLRFGGCFWIWLLYYAHRETDSRSRSRGLTVEWIDKSTRVHRYCTNKTDVYWSIYVANHYCNVVIAPPFHGPTNEYTCVHVYAVYTLITYFVYSKIESIAVDFTKLKL